MPEQQAAFSKYASLHSSQVPIQLAAGGQVEGWLSSSLENRVPGGAQS